MLFGCVFVAWLFLFSFTVFSSSSKSHILTHNAKLNPTSRNPYTQSQVLILGSTHRWTFLTPTEPSWFMPAEAMVPSVITPTLHNCPTFLSYYPNNRCTSMRVHTSSNIWQSQAYSNTSINFIHLHRTHKHFIYKSTEEVHNLFHFTERSMYS